VISTILMICLVVVIVMIVATLILSEPLPDETPYAAIFARNESGNFTLAHMAGDPLKEGAYRIYVDTINGLIDETANFTGLKDGIWSAGEILTYNGMEELERVVITAMSGGTEMILADLGPGGRSRGTTPTETITPTPTPTDPPDVDFTANITGGNAPLAVQFTDKSAGDVTSWAWNFGDGNTSAEQDPIHTYMTVGTYTVNLTASNAYGTDSKTRVAYIDVTRAQIYEPEPDLNDELDNWTTIGVGEVVVVVDPVYGDVVQMSSTKNHADYSMSRNLSTKGYENITVSFRLAAVGFNNPGDILVVEWFDGALWQELLRIAGKEDPYADGEFHEFSYTLPPSANDNPSFAIRFKLTHQGKEEYVYVDLKNLQITGDPISPS